MRKWIAAGLLFSSLFFSTPAFAFYDDVHYALNYYIARILGYTPEQAFRMANACVSVDYSFSSEPTQISNGVLDLGINNILAVKTLPIVGLVQAAGHKYMGSSDEWEKATDEVPAALEELLKHDEFKETFGAQWRFHAFRDTYRFPDSKVDGPPYPSRQLEASATAADEAIVAQRNVLLEESYKILNLGVFLHFFQDEVPHHGYAIGGGHWVLLPNQWEQSEKWEQGANGVPVEEWKTWVQWYDYDKRGSIPSGSTSDWLSYRGLASNQKLVRETADYMIQFMEKASKGKQKPLFTSGDQVAELITPLLGELRKSNKAPLRLRSMQEVITTKLLQAGRQGLPGAEAGSSPKYKEEQYGKHARGPNVAAAIQILNASLKSKNIENIPPISEPPDPAKLFHVVESSSSTGAVIEEFNESVMCGDLTLKFDDPEIVKKTKDKPRRLEVTIFSVPSQKDEKAYEILKESSNLFGIESFAGKEVLFTFADMPIGELKVQVRYLDDSGAEMRKIEQKVKLKKKLNDEVIKAKKTYEPSGPIVDALKSVGYENITQMLETALADGGERVTADKGGRLGGKDSLTQPYDSVRVSAWLTEKRAGEYWESGGGANSFWKRYLMEEIPMGSGKSVVSVNGDTYYGDGVEYPTALAEGKILCGKVTADLWHYVKSSNSYDFKGVTYEQRRALSAQADKETQALWPQAIAEMKGILRDVAAAFNTHGVCTADPTLYEKPEPEDTAPQDEDEGSSEAQNPEDGSENEPQNLQARNAAGAPAAAAPQTNDWSQNRMWAKSQPVEALSTAISKKIADYYDSPQVPDTQAQETFADVSVHIARRQLPASVFFDDPYVNGPRQNHLDWARKQQRAILENNLTWKATRALAALSKQGQENLYSDMAQTLTSAPLNNLGQAPTNAGLVPFFSAVPPASPDSPEVHGQTPPIHNLGIPNSGPVPYFPAAPQGASNPSVFSGQIPSFFGNTDSGNNAPSNTVSSSDGTTSSYEQGIDRPGYDYRSFDMDSTATPEYCQAECQEEWEKCRAWTFVSAGVQGANPRCWLKTSVPNPVPHSGTTSGVMPQAQESVGHIPQHDI